MADNAIRWRGEVLKAGIKHGPPTEPPIVRAHPREVVISDDGNLYLCLPADGNQAEIKPALGGGVTRTIPLVSLDEVTVYEAQPSYQPPADFLRAISEATEISTSTTQREGVPASLFETSSFLMALVAEYFPTQWVVKLSISKKSSGGTSDDTEELPLWIIFTEGRDFESDQIISGKDRGEQFVECIFNDIQTIVASFQATNHTNNQDESFPATNPRWAGLIRQRIAQPLSVKVVDRLTDSDLNSSGFLKGVEAMKNKARLRASTSTTTMSFPIEKTGLGRVIRVESQLSNNYGSRATALSSLQSGRDQAPTPSSIMDSLAKYDDGQDQDSREQRTISYSNAAGASPAARGSIVPSSTASYFVQPVAGHVDPYRDRRASLPPLSKQTASTSPAPSTIEGKQSSAYDGLGSAEDGGGTSPTSFDADYRRSNSYSRQQGNPGGVVFGRTSSGGAAGRRVAFAGRDQPSADFSSVSPTDDQRSKPLPPLPSDQESSSSPPSHYRLAISGDESPQPTSTIRRMSPSHGVTHGGESRITENQLRSQVQALQNELEVAKQQQKNAEIEFQVRAEQQDRVYRNALAETSAMTVATSLANHQRQQAYQQKIAVVAPPAEHNPLVDDQFLKQLSNNAQHPQTAVIVELLQSSQRRLLECEKEMDDLRYEMAKLKAEKERANDEIHELQNGVVGRLKVEFEELMKSKDVELAKVRAAFKKYDEEVQAFIETSKVKNDAQSKTLEAKVIDGRRRNRDLRAYLEKIAGPVVGTDVDTGGLFFDDEFDDHNGPMHKSALHSYRSALNPGGASHLDSPVRTPRSLGGTTRSDFDLDETTRAFVDAIRNAPTTATSQLLKIPNQSKMAPNTSRNANNNTPRRTAGEQGNDGTVTKDPVHALLHKIENFIDLRSAEAEDQRKAADDDERYRRLLNITLEEKKKVEVERSLARHRKHREEDLIAREAEAHRREIVRRETLRVMKDQCAADETVTEVEDNNSGGEFVEREVFTEDGHKELVLCRPTKFQIRKKGQRRKLRKSAYDDEQDDEFYSSADEEDNVKYDSRQRFPAQPSAQINHRRTNTGTTATTTSRSNTLVSFSTRGDEDNYLYHDSPTTNRTGTTVNVSSFSSAPRTVNSSSVSYPHHQNNSSLPLSHVRANSSSGLYGNAVRRGSGVGGRGYEAEVGDDRMSSTAVKANAFHKYNEVAPSEYNAAETNASSMLRQRAALPGVAVQRRPMSPSATRRLLQQQAATAARGRHGSQSPSRNQSQDVLPPPILSIPPTNEASPRRVPLLESPERRAEEALSALHQQIDDRTATPTAHARQNVMRMAPSARTSAPQARVSLATSQPGVVRGGDIKDKKAATPSAGLVNSGRNSPIRVPAHLPTVSSTGTAQKRPNSPNPRMGVGVSAATMLAMGRNRAIL